MVESLRCSLADAPDSALVAQSASLLQHPHLEIEQAADRRRAVLLVDYNNLANLRSLSGKSLISDR